MNREYYESFEWFWDKQTDKKENKMEKTMFDRRKNQNDKLNEIMMEFITQLNLEWDAWGEDTEVFKLLDRYLTKLHEKIEIETTRILKVKGE
tara:strand:+ start:1186 stop:1461 length:276 start_codon:yes stop_codon:yes gene_type:complete